MPARRVEVRTQDGLVLEALLLADARGSGEEENARGDLGVLVTHPHPKMGGNMDNNVVEAVARAVHEAGFTTLKMNFRGVGDSQGSSSWTGKAERKDVEAALAFLREQPGVKAVSVVGYSFGAAIASGVDAKDLRGYVAISYPYGRAASCALGSHFHRADRAVPKLFLIGEDDQFANIYRLEKFVADMEHPGEVRVFDDVDHFWHGQERKLAGPVVAFLDSLL